MTTSRNKFLDYLKDVIDCEHDIFASKSRRREVVDKRRIFIRIAYQCGFSSVQISEYSGLDHSTVLYHRDKCQDYVETDVYFRSEFYRVKNLINEYLKNYYNDMNKHKIFISGKISGNNNYVKEFEDIEKKLKKNYDMVINPVKLTKDLHNNGAFDLKTAMSRCLQELITCDDVYFLKNWKNSEGSQIEHALSKYLGLNIIYE